MGRRGRTVLAVPLLTALLTSGCGGGSVTSAARTTPSSSATSSATASSAATSSAAPVPTTSAAPAPTTTPPPSSAPAAVARPAAAAGKTVVLDPGHNGGNAAHPSVINAQVPDGAGGTKACNTVGTATTAGYPEHAFTWDVALRTRDLLTAAGVHVVFTRPDDAGVGPCVDARAKAGAGAAAFVGIHGDGAPPAGRGFHVITSGLTPAGPTVAARSRALATDVRDAMTAVEPVSTYLGRAGLDTRTDLAGLNLNPAPAVYIECGNMKNAADAALMSSPAGRQQIAARLAAGILAFLGG